MNRTKRLLISMLTLLCCTGALATGELNGLFTINASGDKVQFSQGNLQWSGTNGWRFASNQWDIIGSKANNTSPTSSNDNYMDLFCWGTTGLNSVAPNTATSYLSGSSVLSGNNDWGTNMGSGWRTLTSEEWVYLFNTRASGSTVNSTSNARYTHATINTDGTGVNGMILFPDGVTIANDEATSWGTVNAASSYATKCTSAQWLALAAKGCVFLPAAGYRYDNTVNNAGAFGDYWSSSHYPWDASKAYDVYFSSTAGGILDPQRYSYRFLGLSVRLVKDYTLNQDGEGNYLIGSAQDWKDFAALVNGGTQNVNAKMTADIDLGDDQTMVGNITYPYAGTFDGCGHIMTISYNVTEDYVAPFRIIGGATIQNLHVSGTITTTRWYAGGIAGYVSSGTNYISNTFSSVNITGHYTGGSSQVDWFGGIVGQANSTGTRLYLTDCFYNGSITGSNSSTSYCANMIGLMYGYAQTTISNCLSVGTFTNVFAINSMYHWIYASGSTTNSYVLTGNTAIDHDTGKAGEVTNASDLSSGTVTSALQNDRAEIIWVQDPNTNKPMLAFFAEAVTLTDGNDLSALVAYAGKTCTVAYSRSFTAGMSSTVCLPFAFAKGSVGTFYTFTGITKNGSGEYIADMTEYTGANLVANTPYLFTPSTTGSVDFGGTYAIPASITAGSTVSGDWTFVGTYETISWTEAPTGIYGFSAQAVDGISQGEFVKVGAYVRIRPMRCYLKYKNGGEDYAGARSMTRSAEAEPLPQTIKVRLIGANGEVTAIGSLQTNTGEVTFDSDAWYTLDGVQLNGKPTRKGIYVNNGKKVIIK